MSVLTSLQLISAQRSNSIPPVVKRRNKLSAKLYEQMQLAAAQVEGRAFSATKQKKVVNAETGESRTVEIAKRIKQWWWVNANGKVVLAVRYGAKTLELAKGKNAVEIESIEAVLPTLQIIKKAVESGELDNAIEAVSGAIKSNYKAKVQK